jgi:hypothetical protein
MSKLKNANYYLRINRRSRKKMRKIYSRNGYMTYKNAQLFMNGRKNRSIAQKNVMQSYKREKRLAIKYGKMRDN